jgi:HSP20 family protein
LFSPSPVTDILATRTSFEIQIELPGVKKEDIKIDLSQGSFSVTATKRLVESEGIKHIHSEREFGTINRAFRLPSSAQLDKLEAVLSDGVLTVSIPKKHEPQIEIKIQ